jgi:hypothetical protein
MVRRMSVSFDADEESRVAAFADPETPEYAALAAWAHTRGFAIPRSTSEASVIRALLRAGIDHILESHLDLEYSSLAATLREPASAGEVREARRRYARRSERHAPT